MSTKPLWNKLTEVLAGYVTSQDIQYISTYDGQVPGWGPASILRIWANTSEYHSDIKKPFKGTGTVKATIAITADIIWLTDIERGITDIDLGDPECFEKVLEWMKLIGLADKNAKLQEPLI